MWRNVVLLLLLVSVRGDTKPSAYPSAWRIVSESLDTSDSSDAIEDIGVATMDKLKETRLCEEGKVCRYKTNVYNKVSLDSDDGLSSGMGRSVGMPTQVTFDITSQCGGGPSHELYRMDVRRYRISALQGTTHYLRQYPLFFNVDRGTGKISKVFTSKKERKSIRGIKISMLLQLARLVHPEAISRVSHAERGKGVRYVVPGEDVESGKFRAIHTVKSLGDGNVVLSERVQFSRPKILLGKGKVAMEDEEQGDVDTSSVRSRLDAPTVAIKRLRGSDAHITPEGKIAVMRETERVNIGHQTDESTVSGDDVPLAVGPGLGYSRAVVKTRARLVSSRPNGLQCPSSQREQRAQARRQLAKEDSTASFGVETDADMTLSSSMASELEDVDARDFRKPLTLEEWGEGDFESEAQILRHVQRARRIMSKPHFDLADLWENIRPSTVGPIVRYARSRFTRGLMTTEDLSTVIGSLAGIRKEVAYRELIKFLEDKRLPSSAREDAAIALVHSEMEPAAPWHVVDHVASVAYDPSDHLSGSARLVLGNLLRAHAGEKNAHEHITALHRRLMAHSHELLRSKAKSKKQGARQSLKSEKGEENEEDHSSGPAEDDETASLEDLAVDDLVNLRLDDDSSEQAIANEEDLGADSRSSSEKQVVDDDDDNEPVDIQIANDAINLIHALANAGPAAAPISLMDVTEFANRAKDVSIRHAARDALREMLNKRQDDEESQEVDQDDNVNALNDLELERGTAGGTVGAGWRGVGAGVPNQELQQVKRKPLIRYDKRIYGNQNVEIRSVSRLGIKYGGHAIGAFGMGSLHGRVLDFKKDLATFEFNAGTRRKQNLGGAEGVMEFTFKIVGVIVQKKVTPYSMGNVEHGGMCPSSWFDDLTIKKPVAKTWNRPLIVFPVRCGPALVTTAIMGMIGYVMGWNGYHNCMSSQGMSFVRGGAPMFPLTALKDGQGSSSSTMMGGAIKGKLDVVVKSAVEFGTGKAVGYQGKFMLYYGLMPSYCMLDNNMGICHVDLDLQPMRGKITLLGMCFGPERKRIMIEWRVPKMYKTLKERAYGPLVSGNTQGHPNTRLQSALEIGMTYMDSDPSAPAPLNPPALH